MTPRILHVRRLGLCPYDKALEIQKTTAAEVRAGAPDTLLLLEHPHVFTVGRRATNQSILVTPSELERRGIKVYETNRGGKTTYHGLGQIVGYPVFNLSPDREDVHRFVRALEEVLIRALADMNIEGYPISGLTGVHTKWGKVAAIGVHIARWITTHGFALNVNTDLSFFSLILACEGEPVISMKDLLGYEAPLREVEDHIIARFGEVFAAQPVEV